MFFRENARKVTFRRVFWVLALMIFLLLPLPAIRHLFFEYSGRWLYILLFSSSMAALLTPLMMIVATRVGIVDIPGGRKIHAKVTPLLGGVAIIISFISALLANMILDERDVVLIVLEQRLDPVVVTPLCGIRLKRRVRCDVFGLPQPLGFFVGNRPAERQRLHL